MKYRWGQGEAGHLSGEIHSYRELKQPAGFWKQAAVGFEPTYNGFANRPLRPLGYAARLKIRHILQPIDSFYNKHP